MDRVEAFEMFRDTTSDVLDLEPADIVREARFKEDLDVDSLGFIELTLALEETYDIKIPDPDPEQVETVGSAFDYIAAILGI
ncbi:MAG: acyl carrier protein [Acidimicrobiales bacterium]